MLTDNRLATVSQRLVSRSLAAVYALRLYFQADKAQSVVKTAMWDKTDCAEAASEALDESLLRNGMVNMMRLND